MLELTERYHVDVIVGYAATTRWENQKLQCFLGAWQKRTLGDIPRMPKYVYIVRWGNKLITIVLKHHKFDRRYDKACLRFIRERKREINDRLCPDPKALAHRKLEAPEVLSKEWFMGELSRAVGGDGYSLYWDYDMKRHTCSVTDINAYRIVDTLPDEPCLQAIKEHAEKKIAYQWDLSTRRAITDIGSCKNGRIAHDRKYGLHPSPAALRERKEYLKAVMKKLDLQLEDLVAEHLLKDLHLLRKLPKGSFYKTECRVHHSTIVRLAREGYLTCRFNPLVGASTYKISPAGRNLLAILVRK